MNTRFRHIRSILAVAAIGSPILLFGAFLLFAKGLTGWAIMPALMAITVLLSIGSLWLGPPESAERTHPLSIWLGRIAFMLFMFWLISLPEFPTLLHRMRADGAIWDWRLIVAAAIWTLTFSFSNWQRTRSVSDHEIFDYLSGPPSR